MQILELENAEADAALGRRDSPVLHEARPLSRQVAASFTRCAGGAAFDVGAVLTKHGPVGGLAATLREPEARSQLEADLRWLVPRFLSATGKREAHARLKVMDHDGCRRFHRDFIPLRTIVTYVGPGTEWLDESNLRRARLDDEGDVDPVNERIVVDWARVCQAAPGDILWLKGVAHAGDRGAVHRSPPVQGTGVRRIVLKLDAQAIPRSG